MKIGVEHAACGEAFNDAQFLNPQQNQRRPDIIEKLNRDEQNPERDFVLLTPSRESNTIMSDKHFSSKPVIFCSAFDSFAPASSFCQPASSMSLAPPRLRSVKRCWLAFETDALQNCLTHRV